VKQCLSCGEVYSASHPECLLCSFQPEVLDGFPAHAPALAKKNSGFKQSYFAELAPLEARNFWFRARNRLIVWALRKYHANFPSLLEIGCGTGYVLSGLAQAYPDAKLSGSEIFIAGLAFAAARQPSINFMQMDARAIPYSEEFSVIGAFDVLEHIEEDIEVLAQIRKALAPNGTLLLTVPQHAWLWSPVDDYACHVRRYSARDLHAKLDAGGFEILRSTSFVTTLLPLMYASRLLKKSPGKAAHVDAEKAELDMPGWLNYLLEKMMGVDLFLIRHGVNMPLGGSRLIVARKK
jgi:SAM-dependent methyltransferase